MKILKRNEKFMNDDYGRFKKCNARRGQLNSRKKQIGFSNVYWRFFIVFVLISRFSACIIECPNLSLFSEVLIFFIPLL